MSCCEQCGRRQAELLKTVYGEFVCEDCWDDYICTDKGRVEYLIGICAGDYPASDFDADFLGYVAVSWREHRDEVCCPPLEIAEIEEKAIALGLL